MDYVIYVASFVGLWIFIFGAAFVLLVFVSSGDNEPFCFWSVVKRFFVVSFRKLFLLPRGENL